MMPLTLPVAAGGDRRVLCLGAHSDDIEIGAAGTIRRLAQEGASFHWLVLSGGDDPIRRDEAERSAARLLEGADSVEIAVEAFRESYFPWVGDEVKDRFEQLKRAVDPDVVLTHRLADRHQDHRVVAELTYNTFRDHLILEYEVAKYEGDLTPPDLYQPLSEAEVAEKVAHLVKSFPSQHGRSWFDEEAFRALLRLRGIECNAPERFAEGFHCRKAVLGLPAPAGLGEDGP